MLQLVTDEKEKKTIVRGFVGIVFLSSRATMVPALRRRCVMEKYQVFLLIYSKKFVKESLSALSMAAN
jgi:hypothetical protein